MNSNDKIGLVVVGGILLAGGAIIALANKTSANSNSVSPVETGILAGVVIDNNGNLLSSVSIVLSNASGSANAITDGSGAYSIALPLDDYEITASKPGYQTISYTINILAGQNRQDVELSLIHLDMTGVIFSLNGTIHTLTNIFLSGVIINPSYQNFLRTLRIHVTMWQGGYVKVNNQTEGYTFGLFPGQNEISYLSKMTFPTETGTQNNIHAYYIWLEDVATGDLTPKTILQN